MTNIILEKDDLTFEDIKILIDNEVEESINLDFKQNESLGKSDNKKKEISKDVSSFANSDGGIIIYGIVEENHKAKAVSFVDGNEYTKEWLEQTIQSNIQRKIPDLKIIPIRHNGNPEETIYVVKIPESYIGPHMAKDNRYYKRYNFLSSVMEEYEVRQLFNKKGLTKLEILDFSLSNYTGIGSEKNGYKSFSAVGFIENTGNYIESNYKIIVIFHNIDRAILLSTPRDLKANTFRGKGFVQGSFPNFAPIFQGECSMAAEIYLQVPADRCDELLNKIEVELYLLYTNGTESVKYYMEDIYKDYLEDGSKSTNPVE